MTPKHAGGDEAAAERSHVLLKLVPIREVLRWSALIEVAVLNVFVGVLLWLEVKPTSLRVPFTYARDPLSYGEIVKTMIQTGWVQQNPHLGAPFTQQQYDMPLGGDNGDLVLLKVLTLFSHDWVLVLNAFFLLGFFLTATSAWFFFRLLGVTRGTSVALALIFDFAYFHFARYEHVDLSMYATIPMSIYLGARVANGAAFNFRLRHLRAWGTNATTLLLCIVVGSFNAYWAVFAAITIGLMALAAGAASGRVKPLIHGVLAGAAIVVVLTLNELESLVFWANHGHNPGAGLRFPVEQDNYGLRLIQMITPVPGSRTNVGVLADLTRELLHGFSSEPTEFLGILTSLGLLAMLGATLLRGVRPALSDHLRGQQLIGATVIAWILIATTGGLDWMVWELGFQHLRSWGRVSIIIMFFTLLWMARGVARFRASLEPRRPRTGLGVLLVGATVVSLAVIDEIPATFPADASITAARFHGDRTYFQSVESALPKGSSVFILPIRRFPEEPATQGSRDYDLLIPYLQTKSLKFSYGGMKGRDSDWQQKLIGLDGSGIVDDAIAAGFNSVLIDRLGYADHGEQIESEITKKTGVTPIVSDDQRWATFPLQAWVDAHPPTPAARAALLGTPVLSTGSCLDNGAGSGRVIPYKCPQSGMLAVVTPEPSTDRPVAIDLTSVGGSGTVSIKIAGRWVRYSVGPDPKTITLPAGGSRLQTFEFKADTPIADSALLIDEYFEIQAH